MPLRERAPTAAAAVAGTERASTSLRTPFPRKKLPASTSVTAISCSINSRAFTVKRSPACNLHFIIVIGLLRSGLDVAEREAEL
jgi:hypothetical protein